MPTSRTTMVTGAGGFVGANLVRRLLGEGHTVIAVVRPGSRLWRLQEVSDDIDLVEADLRHAGEIAAVVKAASPDWVFHLATHGAYSSQRDTPRILATNVLGTSTMVEAALDAGVEAFVNAGSSSEYGYKDHAPDELEFVDPNSAYAVGKVAATMYCRQRSLEADAHLVTLRLYSVYGPWEEPTRLVPTLALKGLAGELPELVDPAIARDFVYVDDVVEAFVLAAQTETPRGAVYNVGSGTQHTLAEVVDTLCSRLPIEAEPEWGSMPNRSWDTGTWVADVGRIERELGWRAGTDFTTGLGATIEWLDASAERRAFYAER